MRRPTPLISLASLAIFAVACGASQNEGIAGKRVAERSGRTFDPLPSWRDTAAKARILTFVEAVTNPDGPGYFAPQERIALFDNDGTLWVEQPLYAELAFAIDRVQVLSNTYPEWRATAQLRALVTGDTRAMLALGARLPIGIIVVSHTRMSTRLFDTIVRQWIATARHPELGRPYTDLAYQPQRELLAFLRANDFQTYVVGAGTVEFMRPWAESTYGIGPERVIGSAVESTYHVQGGRPSLLRLPQVDPMHDGPGKPGGIQKHIGRRPILAFGNSDGDFEMLQWTTHGSGGMRLGLVLHHDDAEREFAYDRTSEIGRLDRTLDAADDSGWVVVSMKDDWRTVFSK